MELHSLKKIEKDTDMKELISEEICNLDHKFKDQELALFRAFEMEEEVPQNSAIMEIRPASGGQEASYFADELFYLYKKISDMQGWIFMPNHSAGAAQLSASIEGERCYLKLRNESGVHCVKRVPETEAAGRIHTSTVTVAILPTPSDDDFKLNPKEFKVEFKTSTGPGGQHVNKTESACRIVHLPSGLTVTCQNERSQHQNTAEAWKLMRSKLYENHLKAIQSARSKQRQQIVGDGFRGNKIRSYNFSQNRVTDHRLQKNYLLKDFMSGDSFDDISQRLHDRNIDRQLRNWLNEQIQSSK